MLVAIQIEGRQFPPIADKSLGKDVVVGKKRVRVAIENCVFIDRQARVPVNPIEDRPEEADAPVVDVGDIDHIVNPELEALIL